jgi:hypothetical protein
MRNIFICWSGDRSQRLARELRTFLSRIIPDIEKTGSNLFMSDDIAKGTRWFDAVEKELDRADAGLVCITREALQSGWIHFEAGALARAVRKNEQARADTLYTYLLGVQPDELQGPLAAFQSTRFDREDTKRLSASIAALIAPDADAKKASEQAFDAHWPDFADAVKAIGPLPAAQLIPDLEDLFRRKTFNEAIDDCTRQSWIDRFTAARETIAGLETYRPAMKADDSYLLDLYNDLLGELDGYAMNMGALLLTEKKFDISPEDGKLVVGDGIKRACESRRGRIRQLVTHLLAPNCAPVLEAESRRYAKMSSFDAKKTIVIHPAERELQSELESKESRLSAEELSRCAASLWEFDRIYYYLVQERTPSASLESLAGSVDHEVEKVRALDGGASLIPLHYAIRALKRQLREQAAARESRELVTRVRKQLSRIAALIDMLGLDKGRQVTDSIDELRALLDDRADAGAVRELPAGGKNAVDTSVEGAATSVSAARVRSTSGAEPERVHAAGS